VNLIRFLEESAGAPPAFSSSATTTAVSSLPHNVAAASRGRPCLRRPAAILILSPLNQVPSDALLHEKLACLRDHFTLVRLEAGKFGYLLENAFKDQWLVLIEKTKRGRRTRPRKGMAESLRAHRAKDAEEWISRHVPQCRFGAGAFTLGSCFRAGH
jgi:hypothetical protein